MTANRQNSVYAILIKRLVKAAGNTDLQVFFLLGRLGNCRDPREYSAGNILYFLKFRWVSLELTLFYLFPEVSLLHKRLIKSGLRAWHSWIYKSKCLKLMSKDDFE